MLWFPTHLDHLEAELRLLDLTILRAVVAMRRSAAPGGGHDVYISHDEVDRLLEPGPPAVPADGDGLDARVDELRAQIDDAVTHSGERGVALPLASLAARLGLSPFEVHILIVCLAPELDRKYDRLYAYLQDDISRRRPSADLAISLHTRASHQRWTALRSLSAHAPLRRQGILRVVDDPYSPSGSSALSHFLQVAPRFVGHFLGDRQLDAALAGSGRRVVPRPGPAASDPDRAIEGRLARLADRRGDALVVHVAGGYGAGHAELVHAVAARLGDELVEVDLALAPAQRPELDQVVEAALLEGWLTGAPVLLAGADRILAAQDERRAPLLDPLLVRYPCLVFLAAGQRWSGPAAGRADVHEVVLPPPGVEVRRAAWAAALSGAGVSVRRDWVEELVERFRLTPGQVHDAVAELGRDGAAEPGAAPVLADWYAACRRQASRGLAELAHKLAPPHGWRDLVLEPDRLAQLEEICTQVRQRERVLTDWGLGRTTAWRGLSVLFTGPPGTGKTMAAGVIANQLGLDLYRIDLSQVVSKYIGETEKNLSRIFAEAEVSNTVLLFDEADALFGKRTEVSDAHDRYANIETSYLLQRMEEYEGIAILASNLRENMDQAFLRRLRFVVEFPFPDAAGRLLIWRNHLRTSAPLDGDVDLELLARRIPVPGGNIRNIVLGAAFLAAGEDQPIGMGHLLQAARREFEKVGKLWPDITVPQPLAGAVR